MAKQIRHTRLTDCKWHGAGACVSGRKRLRLPLRYRIPIQPCEAGLVEDVGANLGGVIDLCRPRPAGVETRDRWRARAAYRVLRIVVVETVGIRPKRQCLILSELMIETSVEKRLPVIAGVVKVSI